jgi:hypothetical protein
VLFFAIAVAPDLATGLSVAVVEDRHKTMKLEEEEEEEDDEQEHSYFDS